MPENRGLSTFEQLRKLIEHNTYKGVTPLTPFPTTLEHKRGEPVPFGALIALEATESDPTTAEIIDICVYLFKFGAKSGRVTRLLDAYAGRHESSRPLSDAAKRVSGLTDGDLAGEAIDVSAVARLVGSAEIVFAHGAAVYRRLIEAAWPGIPLRPWGCSMTSIDWMGLGADGLEIADALAVLGYDHPERGAVCRSTALVNMFSMQLPNSDRTVLRAVLEAAWTPTVAIAVDGAQKRGAAMLQARGYEWNNATPKAWWRECRLAGFAAELEMLEQDVCRPGRRGPRAAFISAVERFLPLTAIADRLVPAHELLRG